MNLNTLFVMYILRKSFIIMFMQIFIINAQDIAIFDYDDRFTDNSSVAKYIENKLIEENPMLNINQFSGRGDKKTSIQILRKLEAENYSLIITITTDALFIAKHIVKNTPLLFTNVNNPELFGFYSLDKPGKNITGATYYIPIIKQFGLFRQIHPKMNKVGLVFNPENAAKRAELKESRLVCDLLGIDYVIVLVSDKNEFISKTKKLISLGVDSIFLSNDDLLYKNVEIILPYVDKGKIPVFSARNNAVSKGVIASLSVDYYKLVDEIIIPYSTRILNGENPGEIPIGFSSMHKIEVNLLKADQIGLHIPNNILDNASVVVQH